MNLQAANTHGVANAGAWIGGVGVVAAVGAFFKVLSTPTIVLGFTYELQTHQFGPNGAAIVCAAVAIVGALVVGLLLSRYGRPETVPAGPREESP